MPDFCTMELGPKKRVSFSAPPLVVIYYAAVGNYYLLDIYCLSFSPVLVLIGHDPWQPSESIVIPLHRSRDSHLISLLILPSKTFFL